MLKRRRIVMLYSLLTNTSSYALCISVGSLSRVALALVVSAASEGAAVTH
jgi:hypothetical protein